MLKMDCSIGLRRDNNFEKAEACLTPLLQIILQGSFPHHQVLLLSYFLTLHDLERLDGPILAAVD